MANRKLSCAMLYRWFKYKLKPPKKLKKMSHNGTSQLFQHSKKIFPVLRLNTCVRMQNACYSLQSFLTRLAQQFQNGRRQTPMECTEPKKYVSISLYFEFYFKNHMQTYPIMSREHSGKKLLVSTEILQNSHFKFQISEPHGLQISKFLIFSHDELVAGSLESAN